MTKAERSALLRLQAVADAAAPAVREQVRRALERLRNKLSADRLERVLLSGDSFTLHALASSLPEYLRPALNTLRQVTAAGVKAGAQQVGGFGVRFNMVSPTAVEAARTHAAKLVVEVTAETRRAIRDVVSRSFVEGIPPRDSARLLKELVGLTRRQAQAVMRKYAADVRRGLSRSQSLARSRRYADRLVSKRALTIARTETIAAASRGQLAAWQAAQRMGKLSAGAMKVWIVTPDDRLCKRCRPMDGRTVPVSANFAGPLGSAMAPPLHPNCRCAIGLTFPAVKRVA
jgi:hypothetical protein